MIKTWKSTRYLSFSKFRVKSGQGNSIADIPLASLDSAPPISSFFFSLFLQPLSLYFSFRKAVREPIFPRNVRIPTRGRNREGNSIGALFYKYLSSFESIGDRVLFPLLFPPASFSPTRSCSWPLPIFEAELSQACICSCKSFIRFVRGFASITAMGDLNRLFHLGFISPPILPRVPRLFLFCFSSLAFRMTRLKFSSIPCLFLKLAFFG